MMGVETVEINHPMKISQTVHLSALALELFANSLLHLRSFTSVQTSIPLEVGRKTLL